jgi:hypothetical protein
VDGGVLSRHADIALHGGRLPDHIVTGDPGPAAVGPGQSGQDAQRGGLARAAGSTRSAHV